MNKLLISKTIENNEEYFLDHNKELGFFVCNLWIYCHQENSSVWDVLNIKNESYKTTINDLLTYCIKRMGEDRGLRNGFESSTNKTVQDWIMVLKSTYPLVYKTDLDCLKKMFLSVNFSNPWRDGYLLTPLSSKSKIFYEDIINCENLTVFENKDFFDLSVQIRNDSEVINYKKDLDSQFSNFMSKEIQSERLADQAMIFLDQKERYHPVDLNHIKYMNFKTMPLEVHDSYIVGVVNCLQGVYYNPSETSLNRKICGKEILKLKEKFNYGKK